MQLSLPVISCTNEFGVPNCGACCKGCGSPPYQLDEIRHLPFKLQNEVMNWISQHIDKHKLDAFGIEGNNCPFLDGMSCRIHRDYGFEYKPKSCQQMQPGCASCLTARIDHEQY
jgi:Fe-S-cluster containining protein